MCHHLIEGLSDGLDMYYGTREAWFDAELEAMPQGFCRLGVLANPVNRERWGHELLRSRLMGRPRPISEGAKILAFERPRLTPKVDWRQTFRELVERPVIEPMPYHERGWAEARVVPWSRLAQLRDQRGRGGNGGEGDGLGRRQRPL